jgi:hypothetical protein
MNAVRRFSSFWYDFVVGDDWRLAAGVIAGLGLTAVLAHATQFTTWWVLPLVVIGILWRSVAPGGHVPDGHPSVRQPRGTQPGLSNEVDDRQPQGEGG